MKNISKSIYALLFFILCVAQQSAFAQAPGNDLICNAIPLSVGLGCTQGTNVNATSTGSPAAAACWNPVTTNNDVWYSFVATTQSMTVTTDFSGLTLNNTQVALYSSSTNNCNGTLTQVACGENTGTNVTNNSINDVILIPGNTYFIRIDGNTNAVGTFCIGVFETYIPGSSACEAQHITPNSKACTTNNFGYPDGGNYVFNAPEPVASYLALGTDYPGCDNETNQLGVWNSFTANSTTVTLRNMSTGTREYSFFSGPCSALNWISCTSLAANATTTLSNLTIGTEYFLLTTVGGSATTTGFRTDLCLTNSVACTPPANDNCANALAISADTLYYVTSYCASTDGPPALCSGGVQNNIWFTWTTPANWTGQAFFQIFQQNCRQGHVAAGMQCSVYVPGVNCGSNSTNCVTTSNTGVDNNINTVWTPVPGSTYLIHYDGNGGEVCEMNFQITSTVSPVVVTVNSATICAGDSVVLTATSNATGYAWSTGQTGPSITVSPSVTTTYSVSATAGGTGSAVSTVTVNPIPAAPTAGSNSPVCEGGTLNLTASNVTNATYSWTGPNGFTSAIQNPSITGATAAAAGTYEVIATVLNCPSAPATTAVVVNPIPASPTAANNGPVCTGGTIDLTATTVQGATYAWTGPAGFTSNLQNPSIPNAANANGGTYSVTATVLGCVSAPATTTVVISPVPSAPVAGSNSPVCEGSAINLTVNTIAGATYSWTGPNGFTSADQNPSIPNATVAMGGVYEVVANISGCNSATGSTTVVVNALPDTLAVSSNSPICEGSTLNLTASTIAGATYSWTGPDNFTSTQQNPSIVNAQNVASGNYTVIATVNGCSTAPATLFVVVDKIPTPTATSNSPICEGATLSFTTTTYAFATYTWTGPNGFTSNLQNPTIPNATAAASGTYSVEVTASGCTSVTPATVTVVVNPTAAPVASNNGPLCSGATLNLTASTISGATYTWTGPNGYTSNQQNPSIPGATTGESGTYSVVANVSGCNSSSPGTTTVVINPIPTITAGSNSPLCEGATLNLTASTFIGATYSWTGPNGFTSNVQNPSITGATTAASGTYSVVATASGCSSSAPATTNVIVSGTPATPVAGSNSPLCEGSTLNLTASTIAGATYSWNGPNGFTSTVQNPSITGATVAASGVYSVRVNIDGCNSPVATTNVIVRPIPASPVASSNSPVCVGLPINLTASTVAGATYAWTGPNGFTSAIQNPTIPSATTADSGLYLVTATVSGCTSPAATTNVVVVPLPPAPVASSNSPVCVGDTLFLFATFIPGATYLWTDPIGFTSTEQNPVVPNVTLLAAATYTVVATVNGCTGPGAQTTVVVVPRPVATFTSNAPVCLGAPVNFTNTGSTGSGFTYSWNFGPDATPSTSTLENPTGIVYATQGTKSVIFTVSNGSCSTTDTQTITITGLPFADFTNDGPSCAAPSVINFTDASTGNITSWLWDFGPNATPSTSTSPGPVAVTFNTNGTQMVMLTVSGGGCSNTTTKTADVGVVGADFTSSVPQNGANGCLGQAVNFYNIGSSGSGATHFWNFGAGATPATSTLENPTNIIYASTGAKIVTHTVSVAACGLDSTVQHIVTINPIPVTSFSTTAPVCANVGVDFTNTGSTGINHSYFWDFGAGSSPSTSIAENPSGVTYTSSGTKTVTLSITNEFYCVVQATQNITIFSTPTSSFSTNAPTCTLLPVNFTNTGTLTGVTWAWDFGADAQPVTSTDQNPTGVTYAIPGIKPITLVTTDNVSGCSDTHTESITINQSPYASFTSNAPQCNNVGFNFTNTGSTGGSWSYTWNFGVGANPAISSAENPVGVLYSSAGTKTVTFTVSGQGCTQTNTQTIVVDEAPVASFSSTTPQCTGLNVDFTNTGTSTGVSYAWDFGAGATPATSTDQNPTGVVYATAGSKTVTLTTTNIATGCSDVATQSFNISQSPVASFTSNAPQCSTVAIDFTNTGSTGGSWAYAWSFGTGANPASSTAENPTGIQY
ncbi:MAG TPA: PKD domain-containing protein, partial [Chitinophagales bacterium]|nr:PKD domain-containing protein [Chitinophagales bacterium]